MQLDLMPSIAKFVDEHRGNKSRAAFISALLRDIKNNPDTLCLIQATRDGNRNDTTKTRQEKTRVRS